MKLNRILLAVSFVWLLVSFWHRNDLPGELTVVLWWALRPDRRSGARQ